jgi:signal peptidase I
MSRVPTEANIKQQNRNPEHPRAATGRFLRRAILEAIGTLVPAVFIALVVNVFVAQAMVVLGPSMQPILYYNERILVDKLIYKFLHGPRRGDIVVIDIPGEDVPLIKRVVALPGETIEVRDGQVFIDGKMLEESWPTQAGGPNYGPIVVPPLYIFVLGDNRANSRDSRTVGPLAIDQVVGRARLIYWPPEEMKVLR